MAPLLRTGSRFRLALLFLPVLCLLAPLFIGRNSAFARSSRQHSEFENLCATAERKIFKTAPAARSVYLAVDELHAFTGLRDGSYELHETWVARITAKTLVRAPRLDFVELRSTEADAGAGLVGPVVRLRKGGVVEDGLPAPGAVIGVYGSTSARQVEGQRFEIRQLIFKDLRTSEVLATLRYVVDETRGRICGFSSTGEASEEAFLRSVLKL